MIKRQEIEKIRPRVVHLVFGVVVFDAERAGPFAEIDRQAAAHRQNVRSVRLEHGPVNLRPRFIHRAAL